MDPDSDPDLSLFIAVMALVIGVMTLVIGVIALIGGLVLRLMASLMAYWNCRDGLLGWTRTRTRTCPYLLQSWP